MNEAKTIIKDAPTVKRQRPFVPGKIRCFLNKTKTDRYKRHISTEIIHDLAKTRLI